MSEVLIAIGLISVATIFGSMVFFSCVVAPLVFIKLDGPTAGNFIRNIFPMVLLVDWWVFNYCRGSSSIPSAV